MKFIFNVVYVLVMLVILHSLHTTTTTTTAQKTNPIGISPPIRHKSHLRPTTPHISTSGKRAVDENSATTDTASTTTSSMVYHGGPVLTGKTKVHFFLYGNGWSNNSVNILETWAKVFSNSDWMKILSKYYQKTTVLLYASSSLTFGGSCRLGTPYGTTIDSSTTLSLLDYGFQKCGWSPTGSAIYYVLTSSEIVELNFCNAYCGYHTYTTVTSPTTGTPTKIVYAFAGNPATLCMDLCANQTTVSPNQNPGIDAMINTMAHLLAESITDPYMNAWYDSTNYEIADKCFNRYGTTRKLSNGSMFNIKVAYTVSGVIKYYYYLIQQIWKLDQQICGI